MRQLRRELHAQRAELVPFEIAWTLAVALIWQALDPWREALDFAMAEWRSAYLGEVRDPGPVLLTERLLDTNSRASQKQCPGST